MDVNMMGVGNSMLKTGMVNTRTSTVKHSKATFTIITKKAKDGYNGKMGTHQKRRGGIIFKKDTQHCTRVIKKQKLFGKKGKLFKSIIRLSLLINLIKSVNN